MTPDDRSLAPEPAEPAIPPEPAVPLEDELLTCTWHPDRETGLRCLRCGRPMCVECARQHPVGMRCKECARELRSPMYKVSGGGLAAAIAAALVAGGIFGAAAFFAIFAFGLYGIILAFFFGGILGRLQAELVSRVAGRKRGRALQWIALVGLTLGLLGPIVLVSAGIVASIAEGGFGAAGPAGTILLGAAAYLAGAVAAVRARLA